MNQINYVKIIARLILIATLCIVYNQHLVAQLHASVDSFMSEKIKDGGPGCAVLVVKDGKRLLSKGYGLANLEHQIPFTPETISDIGSVAKQITCFAVNLLIERGKINSVKDLVSDYLNYWPDYVQKVRILDLMLHTSGLREIYSVQALQGHRMSDGIRQSDARKLVENSQALNFDPGSEYMYCNTAYMLLADIIEEVTGESYEDWLTTNVFDPIGMHSTSIMDIQGEVFENTAESYMRSGEGFRRIFDNSTAYGQGGIYASLDDLEKWLNFIAHPTDHDWCKKETISGLANPEGHVYANDVPANYAKGLDISPYRGLKRLGHTGSSAGYRTTLQYFPDFDIGIVIKTNFSTMDRTSCVNLVLEEVLGQGVLEQKIEPVYKPSFDCSYKLSDDEDLNRFLGTYLSQEYFTVLRIGMRDGKLILHHVFHDSVPLAQASALSFCVFRSPVNDVNFKIENDLITGLYVQGGGIRDVFFEKID